jgi:hypothetical protein
MPYVALFIADAVVEVATDTESVIHTTEIPNTDAGIDDLADWLREKLPSESEPMWVATVPNGDGGPVYAWLSDAVPELFLQNPAPLKAFAAKTHADWQSARTLLEFQQKKVW